MNIVLFKATIFPLRQEIDLTNMNNLTPACYYLLEPNLLLLAIILSFLQNHLYLLSIEPTLLSIELNLLALS